MGNRAAGGLYRKIRADERSVSEILGTVLIFSFVIFLSVGLIVIGLSAFQGATAQTEDRLAQDSMQEMGDRLHSLTGSQIDTATEFEFPTGTGDDINALDEGVVNITIETHSDYVGLVEASDASNSTEIELGTIEHEAEDGTITAYQGGALFERQGDLIEILQEPTFDYRGDAIDLSFHSVDIDQISDAESITAKRLRKQSEDQSEKLREMMRPHWNLTGYSDIMAPVTITVTIESEYADAWQMYAQNRMTETPTVNRNGNEVEVVFDKFDGGLTFNTNQTFDDDVFYSGEAALTGLVNVSNATIGGSGGEVEVAEIDGHGAASPSPHYILGVYNETASEWMVYNTNDGKVRTLTGDVVTNPDFLDSPPTLSNNDTYQIDPKDTWTCVVDGEPSKTDHEEFVDYVDTSGEGCLSEPLVGDAPDDSVASPHFNVSFDDVRLAGSKNINTDDVVAGQDKIELDWTVENDYVSNGTTPVVLLFSEKGSSDWIPLEKADVTLNGTGDTASDTFTVNATGSANVTFQVATLDTNDKSQEIEIVKRPERGKFQIDSLSVNKNTFTAGEDLQVDVEIDNTASISDTQLVELQFDDNSGPAAVAWKKVSVNAGTTKTVSINWTTTNAFNTSNGEVIAETYHDTASESPIEIDKGMAANATFEVDIDNISPSPIWDGDSVTVDATVENVGNEATEQDIALLADGKVVDAVLDENLSSGASTTMSFQWDSTGHGGQTVDLTVASADDTVTQAVAVQTPTPTDFDVSIDEVRVDGVPGGAVDPGNSTVTVEATISNSGDSDAPTVWLNGFEDRVVAVDDSVQTIGIRSGDPSSTSVTMQWNVPADVNTSDPEIEIAVDGDSETKELDIESRLVVENIQTTKNTKDVATFSNVFIEDRSYSYNYRPSDLTVHYGVESGHSFDRVEVEFKGENGVIYEEGTSSDRNGDISYFQWREWGSEYQVIAKIIEDNRIVDQVVIDDVFANGNNQNVDTSEDAESVGLVTVDATVENIGDTTTTESVELRGPSGTVVDDTTLTLDGGNTDTVSLTWDDPARTGSVSVSTQEDKQSKQVIIERPGPYCDAVNWETDNQGRYKISNVDQLQCINENGLDEDYVLVDDIDASGTQHWNDGKGFEPIGPDGHNYPNNYEQYTPLSQDHEPFTGEFDGNGHLIKGLHIERPDENFVGLFGATAYTQDFHPDHGYSVNPGDGSLIVNVRLSDVYVVGEQHVGGLAGQAGGTVENARSEGYVKGQEQLVGGLIGDGAHADIDNRLVAEGTVVGGEIDASGTDSLNHEGIGGLVGRATWNTQISTAYTRTDVTGPKYVGAIVGTSSYRDSAFEQMYTNGTATATHSNAGAIVGHILSDGDEFKNSVYWDQTIESDAYGEVGNWYTAQSGTPDVDIDDVQTDWNGRNTAEMQGIDVNQPGRMGNLDFKEDGGPWVKIPGEYPRFQWELEAQGRVGVDIDEANLNPVEAGKSLDVPVTVTNSNYENVTQTIRLFADGTPVDSTTVTIDARKLGQAPESKYLSNALTWNTKLDDDGTAQLEVRSEDETDTETVTIQTPATGDYIVDSISANDPTTAGDVLTVYADITYTGSNPAPFELVTLQNFNGGVVDSKNISGDWTNLPLEWDTSENLVTSGSISDDITVGTSDDIETEEVTINAAGDGDFQIQGLTANDPVTEGDTLDVTATVENVGSENGTQNVLLRDHGDNAVDIKSVSLDPGDSTTVTLSWNTVVGDSGQDDITVTTMDDTATEQVTIEEQPEEHLDVVVQNVRYNGSQISSGTTVEAGATLEADVTVSNATQQVTKPVWLEFDGDTVAFNSGVTVNAGSNTDVTLTWSVHEAMNGSDLVAKTGHDSDLFDLTIERVQTSTKPLTSPSGEPIDVDLEKIAVG